jgi:hypothetical protein
LIQPPPTAEELQTVASILVSSNDAEHAVDLLRQFCGHRIRKFVTAGPGLQLRCAFCGHKYAEGTPDHKHAALEAHIRVCEIHPIGIENRELRKTLEEIANADYRGNRHPLSVIAFNALQRLK